MEELKAGRIYFPSKLLSDIFRQNKNTRWEFDGRKNKEQGGQEIKKDEDYPER